MHLCASTYDKEKMELKKKVVKKKRKEPSMYELNRLLEQAESKKDRGRQKVKERQSMPLQKDKKGMIAPRNSREAFILARFYKKLEEENGIIQEPGQECRDKLKTA